MVSMWDNEGVNYPYCDNHFIKYMCIKSTCFFIKPDTINVYSIVCQLYLNKTDNFEKIVTEGKKQRIKGGFLLLLFSCSVVSDSETPRTAALQASLSLTVSQNLHKLMSIESVMPSNHLILCHPLLLLPFIFPSIRVCCNESFYKV